MLRGFLCWTVTGFVLGASLAGSESATVGTTPQEQALLVELQHLTSTLAPQLWTDWPRQCPPVLLRTRGHEILIGHPHPPAGFAPVPGEPGVFVRVAGDTSDVQAAYPLGGLLTVVMSAPGEDADPALWVLKAAHEAFHCYQGSGRIRDPFVGKLRVYNDLSFPYSYDDPDQAAALRLEAEAVFKLVTADPEDAASLTVQSRLLPLAWRVERAISSEAALQDYKLLTEWSEGVARYTERELARLAATPGRYLPTPSFVRAFPGTSYGTVFLQRYGDDNMVNPIRFVGEGVRGREAFYFLGMGKAYALDRLNPAWRAAYRRHTLDELLESGSAQGAR